MSVDPIYIGSDEYVSYTGASDSADGTYLNSGTCTYTLSTSAGVTITTGTLTYVAASNGTYRGVVPASVTATLTVNTSYTLVINFVQGNYTDKRTLTLRGTVRARS